MLLSLFFENSAPPMPPVVPYKWVHSQDSTGAEYPEGDPSIAYLWFTEAEISEGAVCYSIAYPGDTVAQQVARWIDFAHKLDVDGASIQVSLNNCVSSAGLTALETINQIQDFVDLIRSGINVSAKIVVSQMTPCSERWEFLGDPNPEDCQQRWMDINEAIAGLGDNPIEGVNGRVTGHVAVLGDENFALRAQYESSLNDKIHINPAGKGINKDFLRKIINPLVS